MLMFTLPFKWEIKLDEVEVLDVVMAIFAIVLLLIFDKGNPLLTEKRIRRGVGVPVVPPVQVHGVPPQLGAVPPIKLLVMVKFCPNTVDATKIAPWSVAVVMVKVLVAVW